MLRTFKRILATYAVPANRGFEANVRHTLARADVSDLDSRSVRTVESFRLRNSRVDAFSLLRKAAARREANPVHPNRRIEFPRCHGSIHSADELSNAQGEDDAIRSCLNLPLNRSAALLLRCSCTARCVRRRWRHIEPVGKRRSEYDDEPRNTGRYPDRLHRRTRAVHQHGLA